LPEPCDAASVERLLGADPRAELERLRADALVYGPSDALVVVRTGRETIGNPAGLGPSAEQALHSYGPARLETLLDDLGLKATGDPAEAARSVAGLLGD